jgi:predicted RND superfamily exporter protein
MGLRGTMQPLQCAAVETLAAVCLRSPRTAAALLLGLSIGFGAGLPQLRTEAGYRAFLGAHHPAIVKLDAFTARFGGGLPFAAVWSCRESTPCSDVFDAASLGMAHAVARALEQVPGVVHVDSPATSPLLVTPSLGLPEARRLAPRGTLAPAIAEFAPQALLDETWVGQLVSADGQAGAVVIQLENSDAALGVAAYQALDAALAPFEASGFVFHRVGGPVEFVVAGDELQRATAQMVPVMVVLAGAVLALLFRRLTPALVALVGVGIAVVWTLGMLGWVGWPQNSLTQVLAPLVLVIGVCDAIHLISAYAQRLRAPGAISRHDALGAAIAAVARPCLFTTLTTVAGFLSFGSSGLESFARFGVIAAWGIAAALLVTFSVVPLVLVRIPVRWIVSDPGETSWSHALQRIAQPSRTGARAILVIALGSATVAAGGLPRLVVDASFEELYGENSQVVRWVRGAATHLREPETLELAIELPAGTRVDSAEALAVLERVEQLEQHRLLGRALSMLDPIRSVERVVVEEDPFGGPAPSAAERRSRSFRLVRTEAPSFAAAFSDREGGALRMSLQAPKSSMRELRGLLTEVDARLSEWLPGGYTAVITGPLATVTAMVEEIRATQLASFAWAGALVLVLIVVFFRSVSLGLMALVPTLLPVVLTLGAMGWLQIPLDVGSAMVAAVVLGLAIDDAIHLLDAYADERPKHASARDALAAAVRRVGRALVTTSVALAVGFTALGLSPWSTVASFGTVAAIAIVGALVADLLVLPALVIVFARSEES